MKKISIILTSLAAALVLAGCSGFTPTTADELVDYVGVDKEVAVDSSNASTDASTNLAKAKEKYNTSGSSSSEEEETTSVKVYIKSNDVVEGQILEISSIPASITVTLSADIVAEDDVTVKAKVGNVDAAYTAKVAKDTILLKGATLKLTLDEDKKHDVEEAAAAVESGKYLTAEVSKS